MGILDGSSLTLVEKLKSWFSWTREGLSHFRCMTEMPVASSMMCSVCETDFSVLCYQYQCQSCGRVLCGKCVGGHHTSHVAVVDGVETEAKNRQYIKFCDFCARGSIDYGGRRRHTEKIYPSVSREGSPEPPSSSFNGEKFDGIGNEYVQVDCISHFIDAQNNDFSSNAVMSSSFASSISRSDGEEAGDSERHLFCSSNECCGDISDLDTSSVSARNECDSFWSVGSSAFDSPSRIHFSSYRAGQIVQQEQKESPRCESYGQLIRETGAVFRSPETEIEDAEKHDDCSVNLSIFKDQVKHLQKPLDFENNGLIWFPPPPDNEDDEAESNFFAYDDEDDEVGESNAMFSSTPTLSSMFPAREKPNEVSKGPLRAVVQGHFRALVSQLLQGEGISMDGENTAEKWVDIVTAIAWQAANFVKTDTSGGGSMDPGDYVKVKCIASGCPSESVLVKGVVCTKNIKHKRMTSQYDKPRLILLGGALEYQKVPNQLASFDTLLQQEIDHLKIIVSKIEARRANVVLVEKTVSSYAQEYLLAKEISLVLNVKRPLLERIARCTGAIVTPSVDNISSTRLGSCDLFRVERVTEELDTCNQISKKPSKTLMFFEGCPRRQGCTVLLKGTCREELKKVKHVVQYAVFAAYHLSLETSFLADEGASLPKMAVKPSISMQEKSTSNNAISTISNASSHTTSPAVDKGVAQDEKSKVHGGCDSLSMHLNLEDSSLISISMDSVEKNKLSDAESDVLLSKPELLESVDGGGKLQVEVNKVTKLEEVDENDVSNEYLSATDSHQSILVAFSSHCPNGTVCERSRLLRIKFYGCFDKPLGRYLHDDLFDQRSYCRYCNEPAEAHIRCYTHQQGILTTHVRHLQSLSLPGERDGKIWMWHRCLRCSPTDGVPPATRRVIMSDAAWGLSFGKFLELSFSNHATANRVAGCGHSLQRDCLRYYGFGGMVAVFCYSPINILSVHLPPSVLEFNGCAQEEWVKKEAMEIINKLETLYMEISKVLSSIEEKTEQVSELQDHCIMELKDLLIAERNDYNNLLQSVGVEASQSGLMAVDFLELNRLRRSILIGSHVWDCRLHALDSLVKTRGSLSKVMEKDASHVELKECPSYLDLNDCRLECSLQEKMPESPGISKLKKEPNLLIREFGVLDDCTQVMGNQDAPGLMHNNADVNVNKPLVEIPSNSLSEKIDSVWTGRSQLTLRSQSLRALQLHGSEAGSGTHIEQISNPSVRRLMSPVRVHSFDSALRFQERMRKEASSSVQFSTLRSFHASGDYKNMIRDPVTDILRSGTSMLQQDAEKSSVTLKPSYISCLPHLAEGAHLLLPRTGHNNLVIAVYDDEPASIISYALSSKQYEDWVVGEPNEHVRGWNADSSCQDDSAASAVSVWQSFGSLDLDFIHYRNYGSEDFTSSVGTLFKDSKNSPHLRISFSDDSSVAGGKVKFSVTCYFVKEFDALRRKCCPNEVDFVRSLCRCRRWRAEGGKSKVYFARSLDERFIIKQVTKTELDSFEEFAHEYFKYLTDSPSSKSPTCLAKILGIYQVTVKHPKGSKETKMDLMVMENLFFKRSISRVYDLKGSARGRYNPDTTGTNKVLLDMNLLETLRTKPMFLGSKAKRCLERAVWNDTSFLASIDVMDYSLLVGVDEERKELVLGIIDYMRQYTWDKHLETWVKASGILGGPKNASPTIISPDQYKRRFRKAMTKYFLTVPDQLSS